MDKIIEDIALAVHFSFMSPNMHSILCTSKRDIPLHALMETLCIMNTDMLAINGLRVVVFLVE